MELLRLNYKEQTKTHHIFTIVVRTRTFWVKKDISYDCARGLDFTQSYTLDGGERLYNKWLDIDDSINAILSTQKKDYKKYEV